MLFRKDKKITAINPYSEQVGINSPQFLTKRIIQLDNEIADSNRNLIQAQIVNLRTIFSGNTNFFQGIQKRLVQRSSAESVLWHKNKLIKLSKEKKILQDKLDKITGIYWQKRIRNLISLFINFSIITVFLLFLLMGLMTAIYIFPIFLFAAIFYLLFKKAKFN